MNLQEEGQHKERLLITGATGFIGKYILEKAIELGFDVWVAVRKESARERFEGLPIHLLEVDFYSADQMAQQFAKIPLSLSTEAPFRYVIHNAGLTKTPHKKEFQEVNAEHTRRLLEALERMPALPERFILMSSMGSYGKNRSHHPLDASMPHEPNTLYGKSKLLAEHYVRQSDFRYTILNPTGVYGFGDQDYWLSIDTMKKGWSFLSGRKHQQLSFVYVRDLVQALFLVMTHPEAEGKNYLVSDGQTYDDHDFTLFASKHIHRKVREVRVPLSIIYIACVLGELYGKLTGHPIALNLDKYPILKQRNWQCNIAPLLALGYRPQYDLAKGLDESFALAKERGVH